MNTPLRDDLKTLLLPFGYLTEDKLDEILALVASKMPAKILLSTKHQEYEDGFNDCLAEVKSILKGETISHEAL